VSLQPSQVSRTIADCRAGVLRRSRRGRPTQTLTASEGSHDASVGAELLDADDNITGAVQVLGDSAYGTGDMVAKVQAGGHTNAIKPWPIRGEHRRRVHRRRLRRRPRCSHGDLPGRAHRWIHRRETHRKVRETVHGLSTGSVVHQRIRWSHRRTRNPRQVATGAPCTVENRSAVARRLPPAPPDGGTIYRLDDPRSTSTALHRHDQERRLAATASRSDQPPKVHPTRPEHLEHRMGPDLIGPQRQAPPITRP
jgi:hypothetical protein